MSKDKATDFGDGQISGARTRRCPGCSASHKEHTWVWDMPSKYCQGKPPGKVSGLPGAERSVAPPVQPEMNVHQNTDNGAQGNINDDVDDDSIDDDVQNLKKLELEEEALVKKNKLAELQKLVEAKKKSIEVLKSNIASGTDHNAPSADPWMQKPQGGGKFLVEILGGARGETDTCITERK